MRGRWRWALGCALTIGCSFDAGGLRASGSAGVADDRGDGTGAPADDGGPDDGGVEADGGANEDDGGLEPAESSGSDTGGASVGETGDGDDGSTGPANETGVPGNAMLVLSDGPVFDFGGVTLGQLATHTFTLTNEGDAPAMGMSAMPSGGFAFAGGAYPGTAGTCAGGLDPLTACTIVIAFAPGTPGEATGGLRVDYLDGGVAALASVELHAAGVGETGNLLVNGNAESAGNPPPGWTEQSGSDWRSDDVKSPHGGSYCIFAGAGPNGVDLELRQAVDVAAMGDAIDAGTLRFEFVGWASAWASGNDDYRVRVQYLAADSTVLTSYESDWAASAYWQQITGDHFAPLGARSVLVRLYCNKPSGDWCDAYFDDMTLVAVYP
jgi:hypothetical protein